MRHFLRGRMLHCRAGEDGACWEPEYLNDGVLIVDAGRIVDLLPAVQAFTQGVDETQCRQLGDKLLVPGFIDTHVHAYQLDIIASYGEQLLQWLERYTFPGEAAMTDPALADEAAARFVDELLRHGTTSALVFPTSSARATESVFSEAARREMCLISGKVLMDRNAPEALLDTPAAAYRESSRLIERWHRNGRLRYAVTPRFAITSTDEQLAVAGRLLKEHPDVYLQTHLAENPAEIAFVAELFPDSGDYLGVYERHGLSTERSVFAHCVHLHDDEMRRMAGAGAVVACCPSSNMFLGSGLPPWGNMREAGLRLSVATDVGGGTSLSQLETLRDLYKSCQLGGTVFTPMEAFYSITLGNARALGLESRIGDLRAGSDADFVILDPRADPLVARRVGLCRDIGEEWFVYMTLGSSAQVSETWINGKRVHGSDAARVIGAVQ